MNRIEIVQDATTGMWWWRCGRCGKHRSHRDHAWLREVALIHDTNCRRREDTKAQQSRPTAAGDGDGTPSLLDILWKEDTK